MIDILEHEMNWKMPKLGELVKISKGKKHKEVPSEQAKFRYINIEDLHGGKEIRYTNEDGILVQDDDVIIAWDGANAGKVGVGLSGVIGSTLARLCPTNKDVDSRFLFWFLDSKFDLIKSQRTGATIPHINGTSLKNLNIPLPPLSTQKRLAAILDKADTLRRKDQELLKKYDELAQAIFIDMFGDPVRNEKGWETIRLGEVCDKITDGTHLSPKFTTSGVPFLFVSNIIDNKIDYQTDTFISEEEYLILTKRTPVEIGNILLTTVGSYGNPAIIEKEDKFCFQRHIAFIKPNHNKISYKYLFGVLKSEVVKIQIESKVRGVAQKTLNLNDLKEIKIWLPPIQLQTKYSILQDNLNLQKERLINVQQKSNILSKSLLQQAFRGELN